MAKTTAVWSYCFRPENCYQVHKLVTKFVPEAGGNNKKTDEGSREREVT